MHSSSQTFSGMSIPAEPTKVHILFLATILNSILGLHLRKTEHIRVRDLLNNGFLLGLVRNLYLRHILMVVTIRLLVFTRIRWLL